ncbi:MAG: SMP-30/gluconolactonase/LRE family protein [Ignavibacteriae bacterium]|nr:SMP-30/gluconolactonase/LRE family protein [Ignavibacteriota bacterium]
MNNQKFSFLIAILILVSSQLLFSQIEKVAEGFQFTEGPVWKDGAILFSDIPANKIYKWNEKDGLSTFLDPSGNSNGLAICKDGNLILAQHGKRRMAKLLNDGKEISLADNFYGNKLNSPNDLAVKSDGSIFFTDPPYGIKSEEEELGYYGIFRLSKNGKLKLLDNSLHRPNGIAFSPDEKLLYVTNSGSNEVYVWDVKDSTITNKRLFANMQPDGFGDGMKVDKNGRLFIAATKGIWIYESNGTLLESFEVPGQTTNCAFGDEDGKTLYITSGNAVYKYRSKLTTYEK